ncbi:MAG: DUF2339 domain-containing protein [Clostridiales bacterium]|nr:DUF2339 domain-containing protein [Clostridiales bacterium]
MNRDQILAQLVDLEKRVSSLEQAMKLQGYVPQETEENVPQAEMSATDKKPATEVPVRKVAIFKQRVKKEESEDLEAAIGGTWLNRIGIVAFLFGVAFFLKYAFDNQWIGPTGRIMIGLLAGIILLTMGEVYQNKNYRIFAQGITGGGITTLYLTAYAALHFYQLIPMEIAFVLMVLITTAAVVLALRYDTLAIAVIGLVGGFGTPLLLASGTGTSNDMFLFTYMTVLNLGILATAYYRKWPLLNYLSLFSTLFIFGGWAAAHYRFNKLWFTQTFLIVYFIIFALVAFVHNIMERKETTNADIVFILATAAAFFGASVANLTQAYPAFMGFFTVLMALFYFALGYVCIKVNDGDRLLILAFWGLALTFVTIAIPLQLKANWITMGWAVEAVILLAAGLSQRNRQVRLFAFVILGIAVFRLLTIDNFNFFLSRGSTFVPFLNLSALAYLTVIATIFASAYLYSLHPDILAEEKTRVNVLVIAGVSLLLVFITREALRYIDYIFMYRDDYRTKHMTSQLTVSVIWTAYSIALITVGIIKKFRAVRLMAIALLGLTIAKVFLIDLSSLQAIYKVISFIFLGVILILVSFMYQKFSHVITGFIGPDKNSREDVL